MKWSKRFYSPFDGAIRASVGGGGRRECPPLASLLVYCRERVEAFFVFFLAQPVSFINNLFCASRLSSFCYMCMIYVYEICSSKPDGIILGYILKGNFESFVVHFSIACFVFSSVFRYFDEKDCWLIRLLWRLWWMIGRTYGAVFFPLSLLCQLVFLSHPPFFFHCWRLFWFTLTMVMGWTSRVFPPIPLPPVLLFLPPPFSLFSAAGSITRELPVEPRRMLENKLCVCMCACVCFVLYRGSAATE